MVLSPNMERRLGFAQLAGRRQCPAMTWEPLRRCAVSWPRGVTVSTLDSESSDRGSNPREASLCIGFALPTRPSTFFEGVAHKGLCAKVASWCNG